MINYILPDFLTSWRNTCFIMLFETYPNVIRPNTLIYSFYGTFPNAIWNGGSTSFDVKNTNLSEMKKIRDFYNKKHGIKITFTFTNSLITKEYLDDKYCNKILDVFHNGMNEILVVSPILEKYIREKYPKYKINRSIIASENQPFLLENYNLTVLSKFKNKDWLFLKSLKHYERERTELLCNEFCINNCPFAFEHYREYAAIQLYGTNYKEMNDNSYGKCRYQENSYEFLYKRYKNNFYKITYNDIVDKYLPLNFQYFKLSGRGLFNFVSMEILIDYLVKTEYQNDIITYCYENLIWQYEVKRLSEERI